MWRRRRWRGGYKCRKSHVMAALGAVTAAHATLGGNDSEFASKIGPNFGANYGKVLHFLKPRRGYHDDEHDNKKNA